MHCTHQAMLSELFYPLQEGYTPLHLAAWKGHTACVECLLSTPGIGVMIMNQVSWPIKIEHCMSHKSFTCIHTCILWYHCILQILSTCMFYPLHDQSGFTPLHLAANGGRTTCVERLLSTPGVDVNIKDRVSWSIEYIVVTSKWI